MKLGRARHEAGTGGSASPSPSRVPCAPDGLGVPGQTEVVVAREVQQRRRLRSRAQRTDQSGLFTGALRGIDPGEDIHGIGSVLGHRQVLVFCRQSTDLPDPSCRDSCVRCGDTHTPIRPCCAISPWPGVVVWDRIGFMDLLNTLVDKGLRRELPTREEALAVLATSDDELLDVVAAGQGAPPVVRASGEAELPGQSEVGPVPGGLLLLFPAPGLQGRDPQVHVAEAGGGLSGRGRRCRGRGEAGLPGRERPRADGPGRGPRRQDDRRDQGAERGHRGLRLPGPALRRPGRAAARRGRGRLQPQPQHLRGHVRADHQDPHLRGPGRHGAKGARRPACRPAPV